MDLLEQLDKLRNGLKEAHLQEKAREEECREKVMGNRIDFAAAAAYEKQKEVTALAFAAWKKADDAYLNAVRLKRD